MMQIVVVAVNHPLSQPAYLTFDNGMFMQFYVVTGHIRHINCLIAGSGVTDKDQLPQRGSMAQRSAKEVIVVFDQESRLLGGATDLTDLVSQGWRYLFIGVHDKHPIVLPSDVL